MTGSGKESGGAEHPREQSEEIFQLFVDSVHWQFAKTYANKAPHEYTVIEWAPALAPMHREAAKIIRKLGQVDLYHGHPFTCFYWNGWKYWDMDGLINRTKREWTTAFKLTWNPPEGFKDLS